MIRIVTDSSADISQKEAKELGITVMPLTINFGTQSFLDGIDILPDEFYEKLIGSEELPTTSQASPAAFEDVFKKAKSDGDTVVLMPLSKKISGSHACAEMVKSQGGYDNVYIFDTLSTVSFLKVLVLEAVRMKDKLAPEKLLEHLEKLRRRTRLFAAVDTLEYLLKGGRVSKTGAAMGTLLGIKPIITIADGEIKVVAKPMGVKKALEFLSSKIKNADLDTNYPISFCYSYKDERCKQLIERTAAENEREGYFLKMKNLSPIVGVHTGPNLAVAVYVEKE